MQKPAPQTKFFIINFRPGDRLAIPFIIYHYLTNLLILSLWYKKAFEIVGSFDILYYIGYIMGCYAVLKTVEINSNYFYTETGRSFAAASD